MSNVYAFSSLTGGTNDSFLDNLDGATLADGDFAFGIVSGKKYNYVLDADSAAAENSPYVISPDTNAGTKRWVLVAPAGPMSHVNATTIAGQAISTDTVTTIVYGTENADTLGEYNNTTGVFTAIYAGKYLVNASIGWELGDGIWTANKAVLFRMYQNSTVIAGNWQYTSGQESRWTMNLSVVVDAAANDTIKLEAYHQHGTTKNLENLADYNYLTIDRIA